MLATGDPIFLSLWEKGGMTAGKHKERPLKLLAGRFVAGFFGSSGFRPTEATEIHVWNLLRPPPPELWFS